MAGRDVLLKTSLQHGPLQKQREIDRPLTWSHHPLLTPCPKLEEPGGDRRQLPHPPEEPSCFRAPRFSHLNHSQFSCRLTRPRGTVGRGPSRPGGAAFHFWASFLPPQLNRCRRQQLGEMRTAFLSFPFSSPSSSLLQPSHPEATTSHLLPNIQKHFSRYPTILHSSKGSTPSPTVCVWVRVRACVCASVCACVCVCACACVGRGGLALSWGGSWSRDNGKRLVCTATSLSVLVGFVLIFRKVERGKWCLRNQGKEGRAVAEPGLLTLPVASQAPRSLGFEVGPPVSFGQTPPCLLKEWAW